MLFSFFGRAVFSFQVFSVQFDYPVQMQVQGFFQDMIAWNVQTCGNTRLKFPSFMKLVNLFFFCLSIFVTKTLHSLHVSVLFVSGPPSPSGLELS